MDNESSYNCSFLFSSLVDDHDPDSRDITHKKSEANSNSNNNSNNKTNNQESKAAARKRQKNFDTNADGFNPDCFFSKECKYNRDDDFYISPAALDANTTLEDVLVTRANIFNQPSDITEINEKCEIFTNDKGTVKLCIDGCLYIKNMKSGNTCYWQCVQKNLKNCHGCAVTYTVGDIHYLKRIRREHTHDPPAKNTRGFAEVYAMQLKNLKENLSECRFTKNRWGNPKLVVDGYFYVRHSTKGQTFYWKCEQRGVCSAYVATQKKVDGTHKMERVLKEHSHKPRSQNEMKELRLSFIPKFSQSHLDEIEKSASLNDRSPDIPVKKRKIGKSNFQNIGRPRIRPLQAAKGLEEGDSSSSLSLFSTKMPKLLTLKPSCDQDDEQFESDTSQTTTQFNKNKEIKKFSRQSSQNSISQSSAKSSAIANNISVKTSLKADTKKTTTQKLVFKQIEIGEKCEFVFLIDGMLKMLLNNFAYELIEGGEGKSHAFWKCSGHSRILVDCAASADTVIYEGDHYLAGTKGNHNHPPCDEDDDDDYDNFEDESDNEDVDAGFDEDENNFEEEDEQSIDAESDDESNDKHDITIGEDDSNPSLDESNDIKNEKKVSVDGYNKCEFIVSKRGLPKLTFEGYYYVRNAVNRNRIEICYWKCELKGRCNGTLVTVQKPDGFYVKSVKEHNHSPDPNKYSGPRIDNPDEVNQHFSEIDQEKSEESSEELLPNDEAKISMDQSKNSGDSQDPLAGDSFKKENGSSRAERKFDIKLDLITTARGMPKIARNGYYYCKSSVNKNRNEITYWKCEQKVQCKGFLISLTKNDGYYLKSERSHSHPPDPFKYRAVGKNSFQKISSFGPAISQNNHFMRRKLSVGEDFHLNQNRSKNFYAQSNRFKRETPAQDLDEEDEETNRRNFSISQRSATTSNRDDVDDSNAVPEGGDPNVIYDCEFIISCQGNPKLCLNGYMYTKNRDKNTNFYWNCEIKKSRRCTGYCVTEVVNGKHVVKKIREHNHKPDLRRELLSKKLSHILQKVYAKPLWNPRKIIDVELSRLPDEIRRQLPKAYSIQRMVKRKVQHKIYNVRQNFVNGEYAPLPNMEPTIVRPTYFQSKSALLPHNRNQYSTNTQNSRNLYNNEFNFNNLYNSNNRSRSVYHQQNEGYRSHSSGYFNAHMNVNYNDSNAYHGSGSYNQYHEQYANDDVYNCEIKNEPIDDYGYQHFDGDADEQAYDNSWNNGSAFASSYLNDGADDNYESFDNDNAPLTASYNSNAESSNNSDHSSESSQNSEDYQNNVTDQEKPLSSETQHNEMIGQSNLTNLVKRNQIAKKRIRAPDRINE